MCKFGQYLHTSRKSGINVYAICVGWVNFVHNLRCLLKNLRSQQKFYATAGPTGPDKYELWHSGFDQQGFITKKDLNPIVCRRKHVLPILFRFWENLN